MKHSPKYDEAFEKTPSFVVGLFPILFLITILTINIKIFGDSASSGPNQIALILSALLAMFMGIFYLNFPYKTIENAIVHSIGYATSAMIILLLVGTLIAVWIASGIVPTLIFYGLKTLTPQIFLPLTCMICAIVSLTTGSSWSTSGTIGLALMGIGSALGFPPGLVAGAVISGSYFGDKMSPLSDTTNMAPAVAGTDIFSHIRHMIYTSGPAILLSIIIFTIIGFFFTPVGNSFQQTKETLDAIEFYFNPSPLNLMVPLIVLFLITQKFAAVPAISAGILLGIGNIFFLQEGLADSILGVHYSYKDAYKWIIDISVHGFHIESGNQVVDELFNRGGMSSMLNTIWLILSAMMFGGALDGCKMLDALAKGIISIVSGTGTLVGATIASCITINLTASDQYLSIVVPGRMFPEAYRKAGLDVKNLSRALEDGGTVTSVLVPWNTGGAYHATILGVPTLTYLPYCFFNLLSPIISIFIASMGWTMEQNITTIEKDFAKNGLKQRKQDPVVAEEL